jgi:tetratricopeptide (TPR) repeat protein
MAKARDGVRPTRASSSQYYQIEMAAERSSAETVAAGGKEPGRRLYFGRETATLALLVLLAIAGFAGVSGLSRIYHAQQEALGNRWFTRGAADLKEQHFDRAVSEFRTALLYSRDNYSYQLNLAEALIGLKRSSEAYAYLLNLWEREPENGRVNLELARIAAQRKLTEEALRYYHNTIYATWASDQEVERKNARLELIEFLLGNNDKTQAQSELIALAANLDDDPGEHARAGDLFLRIGDDEHALAEYRLGLNEERRDPAVLAGAGRAAFELRQYTLAERYLQEAVSANASDTQSAQLLSTATLVVKMDPFRRQISVAERSRIVGEAFATAGQRLKSCFDAGAADGQSSLGQEWEKLKGQITEAGLRRNPDLVEVAMELVFRIERQSSAACGPPTGTDLALLLIAKLHERN